MKEVEIKHFKVLRLPISCEINSIYYVLNAVRNKVKTYITDNNGIPIPLIDLAGEGMIESLTGTAVTGSLTNPEINIATFISTELGNLVKLSNQDGKLKVNKITSPDLSLEIVNTSNELQIELSNILLEKINNALQPEDVFQYTDEQAQDSIGNILADTATIDLIYSDIIPSISASVKSNSITTSELSTGINTSLNLANTSVQPINIQNFFNKLVDDTDDIVEGTIKKFATISEKNSWNAKQENLVSGTNIKTIEGQSILGSGNIDLTKVDVGLSNVDNTSDLNKPTPTVTQTVLDNKVDKNLNIVAGTNTKITYDAKGLVISGSNITASDVPTLNQNTTGTASTITGNITQPQVTNLVTDLAGKQPVGIYATGTGTANGTNTGDETTATIQSKRPLKTIEGQSLEGSGNIDLAKSDVGLANVDNTTDLLKPISTATQNALNAKQNTLVSGINIRTINGNSLLGSTDLVISAGTGTVTSVTGANGVTVATGTTTPVIGLGAITPTSIVATGAVSGSNLSGTNTGDNATNTQYSGLISNATHTGDATGATVLTLATVNANVGSFGSASSVPQYTVNAKGLTTASANVPILIAQSQVTSLISDLASKVTTVGTTGNIQRIVGANQLGNSALVDNGTSVTSSLPLLSTGAITGNSFVKAAALTTNILLAGGADITQTSLPISTATQSALDLKANLASPALTGTPTAPAPSTTTGIANKGYVDGAIATADAGNVKLTGNQSITGQKTLVNSTGTGSALIVSVLGSGNALRAFSNNIGTAISAESSSSGSPILATSTGVANNIVSNVSTAGTGFNYVGQNNGTNTYTVDKIGTTTATSFINSTAPATNVLLAGGGTLAQTGLPYLPLTGGTLTGALNGTSASFSNMISVSVASGSAQIKFERTVDNLGLGYIGADAADNFAVFNSSFSRVFRIAQSTGAATFASTVTASLLKTTVYTVATLPTPPSTGTGTYATVSDAVAPAYLTPVMGGGAVVTPVFYNGSNWICH